jgi:hypothetical protein
MIAAWAARNKRDGPNILSVAAALTALPAIVFAYAAWWPYCRAFGLLDYCM